VLPGSLSPGREDLATRKPPARAGLPAPLALLVDLLIRVALDV